MRKPLDVRTLRWAARLMSRKAHVAYASGDFGYGAGLGASGILLSAEARAIEAKQRKQRSKR